MLIPLEFKLNPSETMNVVQPGYSIVDARVEYDIVAGWYDTVSREVYNYEFSVTQISGERTYGLSMSDFEHLSKMHYEITKALRR